MQVDKVINELKYYQGNLPKEALKEVLNNREEATPQLLKMLEYMENNLEKIYLEEEDFFGHVYAIFLLSEFREKRAFPYIVNLAKQDDDVICSIIGDDYTDYLARILASVYNGDDEALFEVIENNNLNEFVRSSVLQTFSILYLHEEKSRDFLINYFKKLLLEKEPHDNNYLYEEILSETGDLRLIELKEIINKVFDKNECTEEIEHVKNAFENENFKINKYVYPYSPCYEYINDTIGIMDEWQCFRYKEDALYDESEDKKLCDHIIKLRNVVAEKNKKIGRNDLCCCGSGKKYKKCCINKEKTNILEDLDYIDMFVARGGWHKERKEYKKSLSFFRGAWNLVELICKGNDIRSIKEYDKTYKGYNFLLNWLQDYNDILCSCDEKRTLYERIKLWESIKEVFDLEDKDNTYWKESYIRNVSNAEFRLGNEEKATKTVEDYLKKRKDWAWGYIEMADWYLDYSDYYNISKAKEIMLRAEGLEDMEDKAVVFERLEEIYRELGDEEKVKEYDEKFHKIVKTNDDFCERLSNLFSDGLNKLLKE